MFRALSCLLLAGLFFLPANAVAVTLKIATVAPEGSAWMQQMRAGAIKIKESTAGRVQLKFYAGGVMGNEKSVLRKIRMGQLQGGAFTGGGLGAIAPDAVLYGLPLLTNSEQEINYVRQQMDATLTACLDKGGFVSFGFASGGFANLMSQEPISCIEELKGKKVWVPEGDRISYAVMQALGLAPVTLPLTDVLTGLQTGLVEVVATSPLGALAFQWHTQVKYITPMPLVYIYGALVVDKRSFNKISAQDQAVMQAVMSNIYKIFNRQNVLDNEEALQALVHQGLQIVQEKEGEYARWNAVASSTIQDMVAQGLVSECLYAQIKQLITDYRNAQQRALE
ncbi:MAG: TRAP transporter substrate-binding protein DctP [Desulfuromonas sp.]|nr:TRAP transporter substrate-binding protein DctP [Desulfuromonas sp.]